MSVQQPSRQCSVGASAAMYGRARTQSSLAAQAGDRALDRDRVTLAGGARRRRAGIAPRDSARRELTRRSGLSQATATPAAARGQHGDGTPERAPPAPRRRRPRPRRAPPESRRGERPRADGRRARRRGSRSPRRARAQGPHGDEPGGGEQQRRRSFAATARGDRRRRGRRRAARLRRRAPQAAGSGSRLREQAAERGAAEASRLARRRGASPAPATSRSRPGHTATPDAISESRAAFMVACD